MSRDLLDINPKCFLIHRKKSYFYGKIYNEEFKPFVDQMYRKTITNPKVSSIEKPVWVDSENPASQNE